MPWQKMCLHLSHPLWIRKVSLAEVKCCDLCPSQVHQLSRVPWGRGREEGSLRVIPPSHLNVAHCTRCCLSCCLPRLPGGQVPKPPESVWLPIRLLSVNGRPACQHRQDQRGCLGYGDRETSGLITSDLCHITGLPHQPTWAGCITPPAAR